MSNNTQFPGRFILAADIKLQSPLHISALEKGRYDPARKRLWTFDVESMGIPCSLTRTRRLLNHRIENEQETSSMIESEEENKVTIDKIVSLEIPIIPASTVGGRLRNAAADMIFESLVDRDLSISSAAYNTLCTGSNSTDIDAKYVTSEVMHMARKDPFFANFGGTTFMIASRCVVAEGVPLLEKTVDMLMTPPLDRTSVLPHDRRWHMTSAMAIVRRNAVGRMQGEHLSDVVPLDDIIAYLQTRVENNQTKVANKAAKKSAIETGEAVPSGKKSEIQTLAAVEVVDTGLSFALRVQVDASTPAHLGLMILALQKVLRTEQIGGKGARGLGRFTCTGSIIYTVDPKTNQIIEPLPLFNQRSSGYELIQDIALTTTAVEKALDYVHSASPAVIEAFANTDATTLGALLHEIKEKTETVEAL